VDNGPYVWQFKQSSASIWCFERSNSGFWFFEWPGLSIHEFDQWYQMLYLAQRDFIQILFLWHLNQTFKCLSKKRSQNNLNIHAIYHNYTNIEGHNLGMKFCAIDTKYKILKSWNHQNTRNYLQRIVDLLWSCANVVMCIEFLSLLATTCG